MAIIPETEVTEASAKPIITKTVVKVWPAGKIAIGGVYARKRSTRSAGEADAGVGEACSVSSGAAPSGERAVAHESCMPSGKPAVTTLPECGQGHKKGGRRDKEETAHMVSL